MESGHFIKLHTGETYKNGNKMQTAEQITFPAISETEEQEVAKIVGFYLSRKRKWWQFWKRSRWQRFEFPKPLPLNKTHH